MTITKLNHLISIEEFFYQKDDIVTPHSNLWGDFNFSLNGTLEFHIAEQKYLSPPNYGLWIPPQVDHCCTAFEEQLTHYVCIRLHPSLCHRLSLDPKTLSIRPFFRQLIKECLEQKKSGLAQSDYFEHLLRIVLDQLELMPSYDHYLPQSHHPILKPVLSALADPNLLNKSLQQVIESFELSERHVLRLCQQELKMSISEWRNRAKIIYAISQLQQGSSIKKISFELGYQHSSSFIEFFKRYTSQTPSQIKMHNSKNS